MSRVSRGTPAGNAYLDLRSQAQRSGRPTQEVLTSPPLTCPTTPRRSWSRCAAYVEARLASAKLPFHVDVNVGEPIWPEPTTVAVPRRRGGSPIELRGYPMHMVHAEKIVTLVLRGIANTRWRDFGDIWSLSRRHRIDARDLQQAIDEVARHRSATLRPLEEVLDGFAWNPATGAWR